MKKQVFGRQFKRDTNERKALFKGLINELVIRESITTTEEKAKAIRPQVEKLVTRAKRRHESAKQFLQPFLSSGALDKMIKDLSIRFADRPGGYTRIVKIGRRFSDNASMAIIELVEKAVKAEVVKPVAKDTKMSETVESTGVVKTEKPEPKEQPKTKTAKKTTTNKKSAQKEKKETKKK